MSGIKNVIICGLGAIGTIYADKISHTPDINLKILADEKRIERYKNFPTIFNGKKLNLDYITPECSGFIADLIIIATKADGLSEAIRNLKNFTGANTIIISLLNGIESEKIIAETYGKDKVLNAYFIGHSAVRHEREITQDGVNKIVFGSVNNQNDKAGKVKSFFERAGINYEISDDILHSQWLKFLLNVSSNQTSAILGLTFGQMKNNSACIKFLKSIAAETAKIAKAEGVKNTENFEKELDEALSKMSSDGKTSMLQDVEAKRKTEVEIFAQNVIKLGERHNISTPYNTVLKEMIDIIEEGYGI